LIRQGDILIVPAIIPDDAVKVERKKGQDLIVAEGEATGHHHRIANQAVVEFTRGKQRYLRVPELGTTTTDKKLALLEHEEHDTLTIPPGDHMIINQREYVPPKDSDPRHAPRTRRVFD
jgi:hypothetical protein